MNIIWRADKTRQAGFRRAPGAPSAAPAAALWFGPAFL